MNNAGWRLPRAGQRVGDYTIVGQLSAVAQRVLLEAECAGRRYVVKFLSREERRGREEVQVLMRAQVEGVVRMHAHGCWPEEESGCHYLVMDYVPGDTADVYAHYHNLSAREVTQLVLHVASALAELHRLGVLHRDLKPGNIMVHEETGRPVLVDFGSGRIARFTPEDSGGLPRCTPAYVSPEAWNWYAQHGAGPESYPYRVTDELWALAVSYYELLTGWLPFGDGTETPLPRAVRTNTPLAPHVRNPRVPRELGEWVQHLLTKDPAARPRDMSTLCATLRQVLEKAAGDPAWEVPLRSTATPEALAEDGTPLRGREAYGERDFLRALKAGQGRVPPMAVEGERVGGTAVDSRNATPEAAPAPVPPVQHREPSAEAVQELPGRAEQGRPDSSPGVAPGTVAPPPLVAPPPRWNMRQRALWGLGGALAVALVLGTLVVSLSPRSATERAGAPRSLSLGRVRGTCWQPPVRACLVREVALPWEPAEADEGAEPTWALSPAPHSTVKTPPQNAMPPLDKTQRTLTRARRKLPVGLCCLTAACAVLVACPATTPERPTPQGEECPPGAQEHQGPLRLTGCTVALGSRFGKSGPTVVALGPIQAEFIGDCGGLEEATQLYGYLVAGRDRAYPRFTRATTPDGRTFPVCLQGIESGVEGLELEGDAPRGHVLIWNGFTLQERESF
jgi:eukaryotic-like serine/threonine-protein kinase